MIRFEHASSHDPVTPMIRFHDPVKLIKSHLVIRLSFVRLVIRFACCRLVIRFGCDPVRLVIRFGLVRLVSQRSGWRRSADGPRRHS